MKRLILFELKKIFSKRLTQAALVFSLLLSALLTFSTYQGKHSFDGANREGSGRLAVEIDQEIAARYAGVLTDEKARQMVEELVPKSNPDGINAVYLYWNATQSAAGARFSDRLGNWNGLTVADVFGGEEIKTGYVDGWLGISRDMTKVFICLMIVLIVMIAPVFCGEYGGVDHIILSSRYGKTKCAAAKAAAGVLTALAVTAVFLLFHFAAALILYGGGGLDCSILFAQVSHVEGGIPFNITCGTMLLYQALLAIAGALGVTGVTLVLSAACKSPLVTLAASAALYVLPVLLPVSEKSGLFRLISLLPIYYVQFYLLMSVEQIKDGLLYAVWAFPIALFLIAAGSVASRRIFAKHQVT